VFKPQSPSTGGVTRDWRSKGEAFQEGHGITARVGVWRAREAADQQLIFTTLAER